MILNQYYFIKGLDMKVQFNTLQAMRRDLKVVVDFLESGRSNPELQDDLHSAYAVKPTQVAWRLWHIVFCNRQYPCDNPNVFFVGHGRLLSYDPNFQMYPDDTNDKTLETALDKVCKEIFA